MEVTNYFTLGYIHAHKVGDHLLDKNVVIKITAADPRKIMMENFGTKWAFQYEKLPDMNFYPRGIFDFNKENFIGVEITD